MTINEDSVKFFFDLQSDFFETELSVYYRTNKNNITIVYSGYRTDTDSYGRECVKIGLKCIETGTTFSDEYTIEHVIKRIRNAKLKSLYDTE